MKRWLVVLLVWGGARGPVHGAAPEQEPARDATDWPTVIAQLREQLNRTADHPRLRQQLAVAYNNYAVTLAEQGRLTEAAQQLEEALRVDPSSAQAKTNLAMVHLQAAQTAYQAHRLTEAKKSIARALEANPEAVEAYLLLGEIEYNSQRLKEAKAAWEKALALNPALEELRKKLAQLNQEFPVESKFEKLSQLYFDIRYTEGLERASGFDIQDMLLKARREVGADFGFWPTRKLVVLIYSAEEFRKLRQSAPEWVAGQYDGKIRVPLPGQDVDRNAVTRILYHEYTHAVVYELTKGQLPTWFNEGLAEHEAWKHTAPAWTLLRQAMANDALIPWAGLSAQFSPGAQTSTVGLAYEQAHSIVRYLEERYGFWRIKRLLKAVDSGMPFDTALSKEVRIKLARLEDDWRQWLSDLLAQAPR